jgi:hypothetical protein
MAESFPFVTFAVLGGGSRAVWVACVAPDMTTAPTLAATTKATTTAAPAIHVFRITGPP